jgi:20S proteasome alpha/beta subunit
MYFTQGWGIIMIPAKPPRPSISHPQPRRLTKGLPMTLVAAFRTRENGILLCADREESDGWQKRSVDKIYSFNFVVNKSEIYQVFITGAGPTAVLIKAYVDIHESLENAAITGKDGKGGNVDVVADHRALIESSLKSIHERYVADHDSSIWLIIVFAPVRASAFPLLYVTQGGILVPEPVYAAQGSGKAIADYLADRLYKHGQMKDIVMLLAAFIFREAASSSAGVGREVDMKLIHEGGKSVRHVGPANVKELMDVAPSLEDAVYSYWDGHLKAPDWLIKVQGQLEAGRKAIARE